MSTFELMVAPLQVCKLAALDMDHRQHLEKLAVSIAHEIRNPLATIKGFIQLLKPDLKEIGKEYYADVMIEELDRVNQIINEFLNAGKPQHPLAQKTSLNKLIKDMAVLYEGEAILRDIRLSTSTAGDDVVLNIPTNQLKQVIMNLMKNAMEAIDDQHEREIYLSASVQNEFATIVIKDNGCGMSEEARALLYIPFFSTKEKGTGLGLSVCKEIIDRLGGSIHVDSSQGKGTIFTISFPPTLIVNKL